MIVAAAGSAVVSACAGGAAWVTVTVDVVVVFALSSPKIATRITKTTNAPMAHCHHGRPVMPPSHM